MSLDQESVTDYSSYMTPTAPQQTSLATVEGLKTRQSEEVKAAIFMAKQFPRDQQKAFNNIMLACQRKKLAEEAEYEFPRGSTKVNGPTIRLAEVLAQNWGNMDFGLIELEQRLGESQILSYAWDIETNTRRQVTFAVPHSYKSGGSLKKLDDPRDIYMNVASQGARRLRSCILAVIPGDIVDAAMDRCRKTLIDGHTEPLADRIRNALLQFQEKYGVTKEMIEKYIGCNSESYTENDYIRIGGVWKALRDGMAKREDYFDMKTSTDFESKTEEEFRKAQEYAAKETKKATKKTDGEPDAADQGELSL